MRFRDRILAISILLGSVALAACAVPGTTEPTLPAEDPPSSTATVAPLTELVTPATAARIDTVDLAEASTAERIEPSIEAAVRAEFGVAEPPAPTPPVWLMRGPALGYAKPDWAEQPLHHDLWDRIRGGLVIDPREMHHPRVEAELNWYLRHPEYLTRVMQRAEPFLYFILQQLESHQVPTDLALLPIVESAFQPFAYSHGRAAGIWQFIPSTGRLYGLDQNWWYDGRRDIAAATGAAARLLADLGRRYNGDWLKALAAYNAGTGNVSRAIRRNQKRGKPTSFWSLDLPNETRDYVPKLLALLRIIRAPALHDIELHSIPDEPAVAIVDTGGQIDLALAADLAGIDLEQLYLHNAGFNRWASAPDGPHRLLLPIEAASQFVERIAEIPESQRLRWKRHRVRSGETLSQIARRYRTTVEQLQEVNSLRSHVIRAGHHLLIPVASQGFNEYRLSAQQRRRQLQARSRSGHKVTHELQRGETLWSVSRKYGVSTRQVAAWNGIAPRDLVHPGQKLVVWTSAPASGAARRVSASADTELNQHALRTIRYTVRKGESLALIAGKFNVTVGQLKRWNSEAARKKYLQPGQVLRIRVDVRRQSG